MLNISNLRHAIQHFDFPQLFISELGWNRPEKRKAFTLSVAEVDYDCLPFATLGKVLVFLISADTFPQAKQRQAVAQAITAEYSVENLLIFTDKSTQAVFFWAKRDGNKTLPREHAYFRGQSGDALISKLAALSVDFSELDDSGDLALVEVLQRLKKALDIEPITKKFYAEFSGFLESFVLEIHGIPDERSRRWYASVLLNRIMFIWFLQKKGFLDKGNRDYLTHKLAESQTRQANSFYKDFLQVLFFEGFAKPVHERQNSALLGDIPYLNGGLFLEHKLEVQYRAQLTIADKAFEQLFLLFQGYSWSLDDSPTGNDREINPDVLGYIFEKYINQKAFGAYYTRKEITEYLCERTIHRLILDKVQLPDITGVCEARRFDSLTELLSQLDEQLTHTLLNTILPSLKLLDPACGSGAFLVAAMKTLLDIYQAISAKSATPHGLYEIKKNIITHNLFGVDIMEEATEIAKLRLFLALVASVEKAADLEPLPNIDFNVMAGNSLVGLLTVDATKFEQFDLFKKEKSVRYHTLLADKNRMISNYREATAYSKDLRGLREAIEQARKEAQLVLNQLLLEEFHRLKIQFEQITWDEVKNKEGKPLKRALTIADIERLQPFHWGYEFDEVLARGGFDAIIANPPWDTFKPNSKEFFLDYSAIVSKNKMTIKEFEKEQEKLLTEPEIQTAWLDYLSQFPHVSQFLRSAPQFKHQSAVVNGKKTGSDVNLYKLFTEQSFNLLQQNGLCGIVIPSGIYTDLGATGLRDLLFLKTEITGLFCFENRKAIFEGVDSRFKFVVLSFEKGRTTDKFPTAFMRHDLQELETFPAQGALWLSTDLIKKLSPDSRSVMEFKNALDVQIAEKMLQFPLLGEQLENIATVL
ncbi:Eco57I restriction-modification methylase domain-containing protein [Beggiatoa leptomitoformis]|uniref:Eco57I restriction-modification methylase domain-containing protein n=1 Tax=Beggiatoa leptomitoformis TaxID=288004 RepID=UPI000B0A88D6|nr:DNA methyltransferase [Beggiatoa leptomitoformis]